VSIRLESAIPLLLVFDVPTAVAFYRDILGFEIVNTSRPFSDAKDDFGWCLMGLGPVELMLNNAYENNIRPPAPDPARIRAHADTIFYMMCRDLDAAYEHLRAAGVAASLPRVAYYGLRQVNFKDPDGYGLCLQWPAQNSRMLAGKRPLKERLGH
jgi:glyoxylase I family protein